MLDPTRYHALTFDCYGTLIDWESGILRALHDLLDLHGVSVPSDEELLTLYSPLGPDSIHTPGSLIDQLVCTNTEKWIEQRTVRA